MRKRISLIIKRKIKIKRTKKKNMKNICKAKYNIHSIICIIYKDKIKNK